MMDCTSLCVFSSCDFDLDRIIVNCHAICLGQRSFFLLLVGHTDFYIFN